MSWAKMQQNQIEAIMSLKRPCAFPLRTDGICDPCLPLLDEGRWRCLAYGKISLREEGLEGDCGSEIIIILHPCLAKPGSSRAQKQSPKRVIRTARPHKTVLIPQPTMPQPFPPFSTLKTIKP